MVAGSWTRSRQYGDPRWQKVAAEIKIRDGWKCVLCGNGLEDGVPLEVHHKKYTPGLALWEEPPENLETRCANCHGANPPEIIDPDEYKARVGHWLHKQSYNNREAQWLIEEAKALKIASASAYLDDLRDPERSDG